MRNCSGGQRAGVLRRAETGVGGILVPAGCFFRQGACDELMAGGGGDISVLEGMCCFVWGVLCVLLVWKILSALVCASVQSCVGGDLYVLRCDVLVWIGEV